MGKQTIKIDGEEVYHYFGERLTRYRIQSFRFVIGAQYPTITEDQDENVTYEFISNRMKGGTKDE
jgi:hypothetical protein